MIKSEKETLLACGNLKQRHLMIVSLSESRSCLCVDAEYVAGKQIFNSSIRLVFIKDHYDFARECNEWQRVDYRLVEFIVYFFILI